jgi:hypothetical protein
MVTIRETILAMLHGRLSALPVSTLHDDIPREREPAAGLLILCDRVPQELEVSLSPLCYQYQHRVAVVRLRSSEDEGSR